MKSNYKIRKFFLLSLLTIVSSTSCNKDTPVPPAPVEYSINVYGTTDSYTYDGPNSIVENNDYSGTFTINKDFYSFPNSISVKVGDKILDAGASEYTWSLKEKDTIGTLTIPAKNINGNINITVNAFESSCEATFISEGKAIYKTKIKKGDTPSFEGETPAKPSDDYYDYNFTDWEPKVGPISEDTVYVAQFEKVTRNYSFNFYGDGCSVEGKSIFTKNYHFDDTISFDIDVNDSSVIDNFELFVDGQIVSKDKYELELKDANTYTFKTICQGTMTLKSSTIVVGHIMLDVKLPNSNDLENRTIRFDTNSSDYIVFWGDGDYTSNKIHTYEEDLGNKFTINIYGNLGNFALSNKDGVLSKGNQNIVSINCSNYNITKVDPFTFKDCSGLNKIEFPVELEEIGESAFENCTGLNSLIFNENLTSIEDSAFKNCSSLKEIVLPMKLREVGNSAFEDCSNVTSLTFNKELVSIGELAFKDCHKIKGVIIFDKVETIGKYAFKNCNAVLCLIGDVKAGFHEKWNGGTIEEGGCSYYTHVDRYYEEANFGFLIQEIGNDSYGAALIEADNSVISGELVIPNTVTIEGYGEIPLIAIGQDVFNNNDNITKVTFPKDLAYKDFTIYPRAFANCNNLTELDLGIENPNENKFHICTGAFFGCENFLELTIKYQGIVRMDEKIFDNNKMVIYVEDPKKPSNWSYTWFGSATVYYGSIKEYANDDFNYILRYDYEKRFGTDTYLAIKSANTIAENTLNIPDKCTFDDVEYEVLEIYDNAFYGTPGISQVKFNENSNLKIVGKNAFRSLVALSEFNFPDSVEYIGRSALYLNQGITSIHLPVNEHLEISAYAFSDCDSLTTCNIGETSLEKLQQGVFEYTNLTGDINLPKTLKAIEEHAIVLHVESAIETNFILDIDNPDDCPRADKDFIRYYNNYFIVVKNEEIKNALQSGKFGRWPTDNEHYKIAE